MPTPAPRLTSRDRAILDDLGLVTVLSFDQVHRRHFSDDRTGKSCQRRLRHLTNGKFVTAIPITAHVGTGQFRHTVYRLTPYGADWLAAQSGHAVRWLKTDPKPDTLLHRVLVARTVLALRDASKTAGLESHFLLEHDRWPAARRDVPEPKQYRLAFDFQAVSTSPQRPAELYAVPVYDDPTVRLVKARPDAACLLTLPGQTQPTCLLLEVDNGTETHSQLLAKLPGYHALLTRREFDRSWIDSTDVIPAAARVLFLFVSEDRMRNFLDRLTLDATAIWMRPAGYRPTEDDRTRAMALLESYFRFGVVADLERTDSLSLPMWATVQRRKASETLAMVSGESRGS